MERTTIHKGERGRDGVAMAEAYTRGLTLYE
jgi:hypothetical protein